MIRLGRKRALPLPQPEGRLPSVGKGCRGSLTAAEQESRYYERLRQQGSFYSTAAQPRCGYPQETVAPPLEKSVAHNRLLPPPPRFRPNRHAGTVRPRRGQRPTVLREMNNCASRRQACVRHRHTHAGFLRSSGRSPDIHEAFDQSVASLCAQLLRP